AALTDVQTKIRDTVGDLDQPSFVLWSGCGDSPACPMEPLAPLVGSVPDTFTYEVNFTATVPVTVQIMPLSAYPCFQRRWAYVNLIVPDPSCHWPYLDVTRWVGQTQLAGAVF